MVRSINHEIPAADRAYAGSLTPPLAPDVAPPLAADRGCAGCLWLGHCGADAPDAGCEHFDPVAEDETPWRRDAFAAEMLEYLDEWEVWDTTC
jgi:hypothetical protein